MADAHGRVTIEQAKNPAAGKALDDLRGVGGDEHLATYGGREVLREPSLLMWVQMGLRLLDRVDYRPFRTLRELLLGNPSGKVELVAASISSEHEGNVPAKVAQMEVVEELLCVGVPGDKPGGVPFICRGESGHLLVYNVQRLRDVINTITSKVVLILGNFSPERKAILDQIREHLKTQDAIPVIFDFEKPSTRNLTETVMTLASMSKYVIADLTSPRSIPHELASIARQLPSIRFYPIILTGEKPFGMFDDYHSYPWIRPIKEYSMDGIETVIEQIILEENCTML